MTSPKYAFDKEQEFFCTPQGEEMYHTDVVEALNALLAVKNELQELIDNSNGVDGVHLNGDMAIWDELVYGPYPWLNSLTVLPEHLKAEKN